MKFLLGVPVIQDMREAFGALLMGPEPRREDMVQKVKIANAVVTLAAGDHQSYRLGHVLIETEDTAVQLDEASARQLVKALDFFLTESDPPTRSLEESLEK